MIQIPSEVLKRLNEHELKFYIRLASLGLRPVIEFKFHPVRKWRFDLALVENQIAVEIEGGTWVAGRHSRGAGYRKDLEKYNSALVWGWRVLRYTPDMIEQMQQDVVNLIQGGRV